MENRSSWLVSGRSSKAPASFSFSMWVEDTLGQASENSSMEIKSLHTRCSTMDWAAVSPRPGMAVNGGISASSPSMIKRVASDR